MMFVSGATGDPPLQTIVVVEDIVRAQVVELINKGTTLARKRGARNVSVEDVMFLIRHDVAKVNRLSTYLAWKEVRKNARDQEGGAPGGGDGVDFIDDSLGSQDATKKIYKKQRVGLPWKPQNMFAIPMSAMSGQSAVTVSVTDPNTADTDADAGEAEGETEGPDGVESDEDDTEANQIMSERLKKADMRTRNMTREEYVHWSECRQASFTFRKAKRFRDWCGLPHITDSRLQDDIMDALGFLTFEIVANITERALKVKEKWDAVERKHGKSNDGGTLHDSRSSSRYLFNRQSMQETPLLPEHIRAAYAEFEQPTPKAKAMRTWQRGRVQYAAKLI